MAFGVTGDLLALGGAKRDHVQRDALDLQRHDALYDQITDLIGVVDVDQGEQMDADWVLRAALEFEDGGRIAGGDGALQLAGPAAEARAAIASQRPGASPSAAATR